MASLCNIQAALPEHLHEKILTFLPTIDLLRLRAVCKQWLQVISLSPLLLRSRAPWLLLHSETTHSFACDVETKEWYKLPPCVLPAGHQLHACVQGLLVAEPEDYMGALGDPWTGSWTPFQVAHPSISRLCGFHFDEETNSYTILASLWCHSDSTFREVTHVFNSLDSPSARSTSLANNPECFMVERNGALYSWITPRGLMIYDQGKDRCLYEDRSGWLQENNCTLLNCGGALVKVFVQTLGADDLHWRYSKETHVIVHQWKEDGPFQESLQWEEVGIMPLDLLAELLNGHSKIDIEFSSVGSCKVYCRARMGIKVLTFDITKRIWEWLPECLDLPKYVPKAEYHHLRGFGLQVWPRFFSRIKA